MSLTIVSVLRLRRKLRDDNSRQKDDPDGPRTVKLFIILVDPETKEEYFTSLIIIDSSPVKLFTLPEASVFLVKNRLVQGSTPTKQRQRSRRVSIVRDRRE